MGKEKEEAAMMDLLKGLTTTLTLNFVQFKPVTRSDREARRRKKLWKKVEKGKEAERELYRLWGR